MTAPRSAVHANLHYNLYRPTDKALNHNKLKYSVKWLYVGVLARPIPSAASPRCGHELRKAVLLRQRDLGAQAAVQGEHDIEVAPREGGAKGGRIKRVRVDVFHVDRDGVQLVAASVQDRDRVAALLMGNSIVPIRWVAMYPAGRF